MALEASWPRLRDELWRRRATRRATTSRRRTASTGATSCRSRTPSPSSSRRRGTAGSAVTLDPQRWTVKTREAFQAATTQAAAAGNPYVTPAHLMLALLNQPEGVARPLLVAADIDPVACRRVAQRARRVRAARRGRNAAGALARGSSQPGGRRRAARRTGRRVPVGRPRRGRRGRAARHDAASVCSGAARPSAGRPGSRRRTPRRPSQSLEKYGRDLTALARAGQARPGHRARRGDPPRHPGAQPRAPRTTPCSSASPAWARPPSSRAWPSASSRATCPRACATGA